MNSTNKNNLGKKNQGLSIRICIEINDEVVEISKRLDRYSIINITIKI